MIFFKKLTLVLMFGVGILSFGCLPKSNLKDNVNKPVEIKMPEVKTLPLSIPSEGWGPNPRELSEIKNANGQLDSAWYTKKYSGKANDRSIEIKSASFMESSCKQAIKKENSKALIESAFASLNIDAKPESTAQLNTKITPDDLKSIEVNNCMPKSTENTFSECECSLSYKAEGGKKAIMDKLVPANK